MKIYKITFNNFDYDQYDSFIISAKTKQEAIAVIKKEHPEKRYSDVDWKHGYTIEEVKNKNTEIILGSFNAG